MCRCMLIYIFCYLFILVLDIFCNVQNYSPIAIFTNNTVNRTYYAV